MCSSSWLPSYQHAALLQTLEAFHAAAYQEIAEVAFAQHTAHTLARQQLVAYDLCAPGVACRHT